MEASSGDVIEIEITALGVGGEGVGIFNGLIVFVEGALPSEIVEVEIKTLKSNYAVGRLLKIKRTSSSRVTAPCPIFDRCGGCQIMHLSYDQQLEVKRKRVCDAFERIGKSPIKGTLSIEPSTPSFHYRNKIQLPAAKGPSGLVLGLYEKGSHDVVPVEHCLIHDSLGEEVYRQVLKILQNSLLTPYDEKTREGELRHVLIRTAVFSKQLLVVLITNASVSKEIRKVAKEIKSITHVKGVIHHKNTRDGNVVFDQHFTLLEGEDRIQEQLSGLTFKISAASFFQINPHQAQNLYEEAINQAELDKDQTVLDAYCGIGTLSLLIAQKAKKVIGVECVKQAIDDAKENAKNNAIDNVEFICAQTEKMISSLSSIDVVFLNPPRKGCDPLVLKELSRLKPKTLIYISCDPATLARDAQILSGYGFEKEFVKAFDMFPQTMHVETVVKFKKI